MSKFEALLSAGISSYSGLSVLKLDVTPDPVVSGTYALRATLRTESGAEKVVGFLIVGSCVPGGLSRAVREEDAEVIAENLEECDFPVWPPVAGKVRYV